MNRRSFLLSSSALAATAALPALQSEAGAVEPAKPSSATRLTIIHTNDVHSRIEPMDNGDYKGFGGVAARATYIQKMRATYRNLLLFDAGDMVQGTPYFNLFNGEPEIKAMNAMGYTAATIGNHDFDAGIERLAELTREHMRFPLLNCNYDFSNTPMNGLNKEWLVQEINGLRIGIFGVGIKLEGLVPARLIGETIYRDPLEHATRVAAHLRNEEKCHFVICLSHINIHASGENNPAREPGDRDIARTILDVDLVIGGHNHYLLPVPESCYRTKAPNMAYIAQAGWGGTHMGLLHFDLYDSTKRELAHAQATPLHAIG